MSNTATCLIRFIGTDGHPYVEEFEDIGLAKEELARLRENGLRAEIECCTCGDMDGFVDCPIHL